MFDEGAWARPAVPEIAGCSWTRCDSRPGEAPGVEGNLGVTPAGCGARSTALLSDCLTRNSTVGRTAWFGMAGQKSGRPGGSTPLIVGLNQPKTKGIAVGSAVGGSGSELSVACQSCESKDVSNTFRTQALLHMLMLVASPRVKHSVTPIQSLGSVSVRKRGYGLVLLKYNECIAAVLGVMPPLCLSDEIAGIPEPRVPQ
ncbi:hypothetical protein VTK26DRAFT_7645 [Humicola hyalothermophila]